MKKVLFIASTGGHLNELMQLAPMFDKYDYHIITTGTHTAVPICYIGKLFGSKIIFIETFANNKTKTLSGRMIYPIANLFIVQWKEMLKLYPKAVYGGWIY